MIIKYILINYHSLRNKSYSGITSELKRISDQVIENDYNDLIRTLKYHKVKWKDIDLFLYWSKGLRIVKKISLKSLGIQLGYSVVQELPYNPNTILSKEDLPKLRYYNYTHDLGILDLLTTKMEPDIKLRAYIKEEYNIEC